MKKARAVAKHAVKCRDPDKIAQSLPLLARVAMRSGSLCIYAKLACLRTFRQLADVDRSSTRFTGASPLVPIAILHRCGGARWTMRGAAFAQARNETAVTRAVATLLHREFAEIGAESGKSGEVVAENPAP